MRLLFVLALLASPAFAQDDEEPIRIHRGRTKAKPRNPDAGPIYCSETVTLNCRYTDEQLRQIKAQEASTTSKATAKRPLLDFGEYTQAVNTAAGVAFVGLLAAGLILWLVERSQ